MTRTFQARRPRFFTTSVCAIALSLGLATLPVRAFAEEANADDPAVEEAAAAAEAEAADPADAEDAASAGATEDTTAADPAAAPSQDEPAGLTRTPYQPAEGAYIITGISANKVVDVVSGKVWVEGTGIQTYTSNNSPAQRWFITEYKGHYLITSAMSNYVLQVEKKSEKQATVTLATSNGSEDQLWDFSKLSNGAYEIRSVSTGFVLDIKGASTENKATIQAYRSNDSAAQQWSLLQQKAVVDDGIYTISTALNSKMVLDVPSGSLSDGTGVQLWTSNGSMAQKWALAFDEKTGYYTITSVNSGMALAVDGAGYNKDKLCQTAPTDAASQLWCIIKRGNGQLLLVSATAGRCIDVPSANAAKGVRPQVYTRNGSEAQGWALTPTSLVVPGLYKLTSRLETSKLIDVAGGSLEKDAKLQIYGSNGSLAQKWVVSAESDEQVTIKNAASGLYLCDAGSALQGTDDPTSEAAQWKAIASPAGGITFINVSTGKAIDVSGGKKTNGTAVSVHKYNGTIAQTWRLDTTTPITDGMYTLLSRADKSKVLDVKSASTDKGGVVQLWGGNGTNAQKWTIKSLGGGLYSIINVNSGLVLDVKSGSVKAGTALQQWSSNGTVAQKWKISVGEKGGLVFTSAGGDFCIGLSGDEATKGAAAVLDAPGSETTSAWIFSATKKAVDPTFVDPVTGEPAYVAPSGIVVGTSYQAQMVARANAATSATFNRQSWGNLNDTEKQAVRKKGSATNWYITVDKGTSQVKDSIVCVLHYNNGSWQVVRSYKAITHNNTFTGHYIINHKGQTAWTPGQKYNGVSYTLGQLMQMNPYWMCYYHTTETSRPGYPNGVESGQGFHGGAGSGGCVAMPDENNGQVKWMWENVPVHTTVDIF